MTTEAVVDETHERPEALPPAYETGLRGRLAALADRVGEAAGRAGRDPADVTILLATKTQPAAAIGVAIEAGFRLVGENRVQELVAKAPALAPLPHTAHLIGPLQRNKARAAIGLVACVQTVADLRLAERLNTLAAEVRAEPFAVSGAREPGSTPSEPPAVCPLDVMIQVNTSGEASKSGCQPEAAVELAAAVGRLPHLRLTGLMTSGLNSPDQVAVGRGFQALRAIRDEVVGSGAPGTAAARELSMGMSGDLAIAIAEGSTMVRIGTAAFGPRA